MFLRSISRSLVPFWSRPGRSAALVACCGLVLLAAGCGSGGDTSPVTASASATTQTTGGSVTIGTSRVETFAITRNDSGQITEVGFTIPAALVALPPAPITGGRARSCCDFGTLFAHTKSFKTRAEATVPAPSSTDTYTPGPLGAFVSLPFPEAVQRETFLNHLELHWNPSGHEPERYGVPHFDFHFYGVPESEVRGVVPPETQAPAPERVPDTYAYPGVEAIVPQMGVHAIDRSEFAPGAAPFGATMILGYWHGQMTFVEPMITQELLLRKEPIALTIPKPTVLGRTTRYPTQFTAVYDATRETYVCTLSEFVDAQ